MPPFDREGALKSAEKALSQGRIDAAIAEYVKIVEAQPRDWNSANALGDLYVRASQIDKGVAQYTRIADHLADRRLLSEGGRALQEDPQDQARRRVRAAAVGRHRRQAGPARRRQDSCFRPWPSGARKRGDKKGAAEISVRIGTLDPEDLDARLARRRGRRRDRRHGHRAARVPRRRGPAREAGQAGRGARRVRRPRSSSIRRTTTSAPGSSTAYLAAGALDTARKRRARRRRAQADRAGARSSRRRPTRCSTCSARSRRSIRPTSRCAPAWRWPTSSRGDLARARTYLSPETAGDNAALWLTLAEIELLAGRIDEGRAAVARRSSSTARSARPPSRSAAAWPKQSPEAGYPCHRRRRRRGAGRRRLPRPRPPRSTSSSRACRYHLVALMRLVEICVDGGLEATMYEAQAQLADAYLEVGRGLEARIISEDLVAREPWNRANIERFRRALVMLGEADPDAIIADRLSGDSPFLATDKLDLNEGVDVRRRRRPPRRRSQRRPSEEATRPATTRSTERRPSPTRGAESPAAPPHAGRRPRQPRALARSGLPRAARRGRPPVVRRGARPSSIGWRSTYREMGMIDDAIKALELAARSPRQRFDAASMLGRLLPRAQGQRPGRRVVRARRRSAGADARRRPRAALRSGADARDGRRERARAGGVRRARVRIGRLSATWPAASIGCRKSRPEGEPLFRRLLFVALLLEAGLLLMLIPWSAFWDRNYFVELVAGPRRAAHQQLRARRRHRPGPGQRLGRPGRARRDLFGSRTPGRRAGMTICLVTDRRRLGDCRRRRAGGLGRRCLEQQVRARRARGRRPRAGP